MAASSCVSRQLLSILSQGSYREEDSEREMEVAFKGAAIKQEKDDKILED